MHQQCVLRTAHAAHDLQMLYPRVVKGRQTRAPVKRYEATSTAFFTGILGFPVLEKACIILSVIYISCLVNQPHERRSPLTCT